MASALGQVVHTGDSPIKILKWRINAGSRLSHGTGLLLYEPINSTSPSVVSDSPLKLKSCHDGTVEVLVANEGSVVNPGDVLLQLKQCTHPIVMKDLCAECGADLRELDNQAQDGMSDSVASISMIHHVPELRVSHEQAQQLGKADERRLLSQRKLVLLVDLDQTLIHTTSDDVPPNLKDVHHFQLYGPQSPWYHTRIRPGTQHFLDQVSQYYELHICTFGARPYAHTIASLLDPDGKYFSYRILSRDECFNPTSKTGNLKALFPCGDSMVCIIDDREDVWNYALNLVPVKPYIFFKNIGDINAPGGVQARRENVRWPEVVQKTPDFTENGEVAEALDEDPKITSHLPASANGGDVCENKNDADINQEDGGSSVKVEEARQSGDASATLEDEGTSQDLSTLQIAGGEVKVADEDIKTADRNIEIAGCDNNVGDVEVKTAEGEVKSLDGDVERADVLVKHDDSEEAASAELVTADGSSASNAVEGNKESSTRDDAIVAAVPDKDMGNLKPKMEDQWNHKVEDDDDYLLYLEEILRTIHKAYYDIFDQLQAQHSKEVPDLKHVVPYVRRKCLKGVQLVFSGVIPTNQDPEKSKIYQVAVNLGAKVVPDLGPGVTHLVAARPGTAKTNRARRMGSVHLVNPGWLWCCAERWEHVDEKLFPFTKCENVVTSLPRPVTALQSSAPVAAAPGEGVQQRVAAVCTEMPVYDPITGKRIRTVEQRELKEFPASTCSTLSNPLQDTQLEDSCESDGSLAERTNPHFSMSTDELKAMDREVEDACSEGDDEDSSDDADSRPLPPIVSEDESSVESLTGGECPKGWRKRKMHLVNEKKNTGVVDDLNGVYEDDQELPVSKFPRCELPEDSDRSVTGDGESSENSTVGSADEEMAAAVEREFLGL